MSARHAGVIAADRRRIAAPAAGAAGDRRVELGLVFLGQRRLLSGVGRLARIPPVGVEVGPFARPVGKFPLRRRRCTGGAQPQARNRRQVRTSTTCVDLVSLGGCLEAPHRNDSVRQTSIGVPGKRSLILVGVQDRREIIRSRWQTTTQSAAAWTAMTTRKQCAPPVIRMARMSCPRQAPAQASAVVLQFGTKPPRPTATRVVA